MGGLVSGVVGGLLGGGGGLLGGVMNSLTGNIVGKLSEAFGFDQVFQGVMNLAGDFLQSGLNTLLDMSPLPDFLKDMAKGTVGNAIESVQEQISPEAQEAVNEGLGEDVKGYIEQLMQDIRGEAENEQKKEARSGGSGGSDGGHWLIVLAKAMGKVSGEQLQNMIDTQQHMTTLDGEKDAKEFAEANAKFQAESKLYTMTSESIGTVLKSIGEGMNTLARKQ